MTLSKLEIQQMLREMHVKFHADETYEALKQRLQAENHSLWLESVSKNRTAAGDAAKIVVRKRKKPLPQPDVTGDASIPSNQPDLSGKPDRRGLTSYPRHAGPVYRPRPIEKPASGKPWKTVADGTEPFNRTKKVFDSVLQRAGMCCEGCGIKADPSNTAEFLQPYYILPLIRGGEHSIKNVVALCPTCLESVQKDPSSKAIKDLKRKTRSKLYHSLEVMRKKTVHTRLSSSNPRK